jgi:hypothetical protein
VKFFICITSFGVINDTGSRKSLDA